MKQKLFSMLALLLMAATGAMAQTETLLTTITPTAKTTFSETTSGVVTVTHDNNDFSNDYGWLWDSQSGSLTVVAKEGYTITRCEFKQNAKTPATITSSPFAITFDENGTCEQCDEFMDGVTSIEVYGYAPAPAATTYSVTLAEGTEDFDKWTIEPKTGLKGGEPVTATYKGEKKVKSVKAVKKGASGTDLATITADYEAKDGETLTGTLASNVKISIADGATVTLKDVNITNLGDNCDWAGINCPGDATLVLAGTNTVCAGRGGDGNNNYPGIWIASGKTLTIQGDGTLTAYSNVTFPYGAGIGGGYNIACGNIVINSGTITATGGLDAAGIGGGQGAGCGNITISGGTVTATGGNHAAGIGGGGDGADYASCGNITISGGTVEATGGKGAAGIGGGRNNGVCGTITITSGVTSVKATKGEGAESIGKGNEGQDITVNIEAGANVTVTLAYPITVTWNNDDINGSGKSFTKDGVTIAANYIYFTDKTFMGGGTFTTSLGNFTKIEVTAKACEVSGSGWSGTTWTGNASSVPFSGDIDDRGAGTIKFVFTIGPAN